ncbi:MAG TPA: hypothetical protein VJI98_04870 [Candidatus Nanoarchaeia archaeon]|nr:hypothetical protein [Candidatus Nanoarchaeia archaeon]
MKHKKKGQVQITFNWVYVLIAGAVILLFFVGLIARQKSISDNRLAADVIRIMESIFTGAQVSEQTKRLVDTGGLADKTLFFRCSEGVGEYGIEGLPARTQNVIDSIFAPTRLEASSLILWSIPYKMPFKVSDFLFVTSSDVKYYLVGDGQGFARKFIGRATDENPQISIKVEKVISLSEIPKGGDDLQYRIIDVDGVAVSSDSAIPPGLRDIEDDKVTAVSFTGNNEVVFFKKSGNRWLTLNQQPIPLISLGSEDDPAKQAAIFTDDPSIYKCNMQKAFQRLWFLSEVYEGKTKELIKYYELNPGFGNCQGFVSGFIANEGNVVDNMVLLRTRAHACARILDNSCRELNDYSQRLKRLNQMLEKECPLALY